MEPALAKQGIGLRGVKIVSAAPARSDLRYFRNDEKEEALKVREALIALGLPPPTLKKINGLEQTARPRQYELWLASDGIGIR